MHGEEHHVTWVDLECKSHEERRLHDESELHIFRNFLWRPVSFKETLDDEAPVTDWSPEVGGPWTDGGVDEFH